MQNGISEESKITKAIVQAVVTMADSFQGGHTAIRSLSTYKNSATANFETERLTSDGMAMYDVEITIVAVKRSE